MVESTMIVLREQLPLLPDYVAPRTPTEQRLAEIWRQVLAMDEVGITDRYEDLGGNSLLAAGVFSEIEKSFGIKIPMATLFDAPTVEQLARKIDQLTQSSGR
jgi:acyl carrier protein